MAFGMGLHGEPGLSESPLCDAENLATLLVELLLAERPPEISVENQRVVVLLNGLGTFKYEELFMLFAAVHEQLKQAGVDMVDCECGELVTSLDMAGLSLSLFWLDEELDPLWNAPADSPSYRRGSVKPPCADVQSGEQAVATRPAAQPAAPSSSGSAVELMAPQRALLARFTAAETISQQKEKELGALDAVAGDGDHGLGMLRGSQGAITAVRSALERGLSTGEALMEAGEAWSDHGGGTSGALWGGGLLAAGQALTKAPKQVNAQQVVTAVNAALQAVRGLGQAALGDKTMLDAFEPFQARLQGDLRAGLGLEEALRNAADDALAAAQATADLLPRLGRARPHGERSLGHPDPGAISLAYCLIAAIRPSES